MTKFTLLASAAAVAFVQARSGPNPTSIGITAIDDQIDDIEIDVNRDMQRSEDAARFGNPDDRSGFSRQRLAGLFRQDPATPNRRISRWACVCALPKASWCRPSAR